MPRQMVMVPRVPMKGGSLNLPTSTPLMRPTARQATRSTSRASSTGAPLQIMVAEIMADMPSTEPMDRSMLPVIHTMPWPMPTRR